MSTEVYKYAQDLAASSSAPYDVWSENKLTSTPFLQASDKIKKECLDMIASGDLTSEAHVASFCIKRTIEDTYEAVVKRDDTLEIDDLTVSGKNRSSNYDLLTIHRNLLHHFLLLS
jgi:hypothetical protein